MPKKLNQPHLPEWHANLAGDCQCAVCGRGPGQNIDAHIYKAAAATGINPVTITVEDRMRGAILEAMALIVWERPADAWKTLNEALRPLRARNHTRTKGGCRNNVGTGPGTGTASMGEQLRKKIMTTEEIHDLIRGMQMADTPESAINQTGIVLERLNNKLAEVEDRLNRVDRAASHAANVASCLANGIKPD